MRRVGSASTAIIAALFLVLASSESASATPPPTQACSSTVPFTGLGYDVGFVTAICVNSGTGAGSWVAVVAFPSTRSVSIAGQTCVVAVQPNTALCLGVGTDVTKSTYGPEELTVYPPMVCVWEPLGSPSAGSYCNFARVTVGYSTTDPWHYTYYLDAVVCPVPTAQQPACLPEITVPFDSNALGILG
jgi:hypothetical protein